jgi:hypothetical protein
MENLDDDVSYLDVKKEDMVPIPPQEKVWATIGDNLQLEYIDWEVITGMAAQFDELHKANQEKSESHVMCKLITLVRNAVAEETEVKIRAQYEGR